MAHGVILGQSIPDLNNNYLALDGSNAMTGKLKANGGLTIENSTHTINLFTNTNNPLSIAYNNPYGRPQINASNLWLNSNNIVSGQINLGFNNSQKFLVENDEVSTFVPLNMRNYKIVNLANGVADTDAATVGQLNAAVASSGPQYDHPTGNTNFDFYGLSVITQRTITSRTSITVAESRCFTAAYTYIYREPEDGDYFKVGFRDIGDITLQYEKPYWIVHSALDDIISGTVLPLIGRITIS